MWDKIEEPKAFIIFCSLNAVNSFTPNAVHTHIWDIRHTLDSVRLNRLLLHCQWKDGIKCGWMFCVCGTNTWNFICIIASRAYWTSWMLNTNLYSWRYIIRYVSVSFARSTIHSEVQIILWDLCSSISSFFFVSTIVIVVCVPFFILWFRCVTPIMNQLFAG